MPRPVLIDHTGQRFNRLLVIEKAGNVKYGAAKWRCVCDCGREVVVIGRSLRIGDATSCGCYSRTRLPDLNRRHGETGSALYVRWSNMRRRCADPRNKSFANYGGRGIKVCAEWQSYETFRDWARATGYDETLSLERVDVDGDYCPENCTWIERSKQAWNRRLMLLNSDGVPWTRVAEENFVSKYTFWRRLKQGWEVEAAALTPTRKTNFTRRKKGLEPLPPPNRPPLKSSTDRFTRSSIGSPALRASSLASL